MKRQCDKSTNRMRFGSKFLSIVMTGILMLGIATMTAGQAVAAPPPGGAAEELLNLLQGIQDSLADLEEKAGFKAVEFDFSANPPDDSSESWDVLPFEQGYAYSGHLEAVFSPNTGNRIVLVCGNTDSDIGGFFVIDQVDDKLIFERDFSCSFLTIFLADYGSDPSDAGTGSAKGILTYARTDDVELQD